MAAKKTGKGSSKKAAPSKKGSTSKAPKKKSITTIKDLDLDDVKGGFRAGCGSQEGAYTS